jgi:hypothetical protein
LTLNVGGYKNVTNLAAPNNNKMKPLLTFAAALIAMAAADQDQIIVALIFMCVSVYFFLKSLEHEQH